MEEYSVIGKRIPRVDGKVKVTGDAKYAADFELPGMLWCKILRSPHAHARILNVDASRGEVQVGIALAEPVMTFGNTPSTAPHLLWSETHDLNHLLPRFSFDDCQPVRANSVEHVVQFANSPAELCGKEVVLLFRMFDADLYGFRSV